MTPISLRDLFSEAEMGRIKQHEAAFSSLLCELESLIEAASEMPVSIWIGGKELVFTSSEALKATICALAEEFEVAKGTIEAS